MQQIALWLPAYSSLFQLIPTYFPPTGPGRPTYSNLFQLIPGIKNISPEFFDHRWTRMNTDSNRVSTQRRNGAEAQTAGTGFLHQGNKGCLLYTSDAADERS